MKPKIQVAGCVIKKDGKYLLVQEKKKQIYGLWNLPAGHVEEGETPESAAVRETKEETGFDVVIDEKLATRSVVNEKGVEILLHSYAAHINDRSIDFSSNKMLGTDWKSYDEIESLHKDNKLRNEWTYDNLKMFEDRS